MSDDTATTVDETTPKTPAAPPEAAPEQWSHEDAYARAMAALGADEDEPEGEQETPAEGEPPPAAEGEAEAAAPEKDDKPKDERTERESRRWAALVEEEQRVLRERQAAKAEREQFQQEREKLEADLAPLRQAQQAMEKGDGLAVLKALGIDYNQLTAAVLKGGDQVDLEPVVAPLKSEVEELRKKLEEREQTLTKQQQEQQWNQLRSQVTQTIESGKDERWELLSGIDSAADEVLQLIQIEWDRAGRPAQMPLTYEEAADKLERYLVEDAKKRLGAKKLKALFGASTPTPQTESKAQNATDGAAETTPDGPAASAKTLTNQHAAEVTRSGNTADPDECRRRALAVAEQLG